MLLTILTPTYNRAGMLPQLYNSLKKQACKDFEWVIEFMQPELKWKYRIKGAIQYIVYGKFAGYTTKFLYSNIKTKLLVSISFLPGILIYNVWKRKSDFVEE